MGLMTSSVEAKKKLKMPAAQKSQAAKQHRADVKQAARGHKAPKPRKLKHNQKVN
jgi:hypothetical protein